MKNYSVLVDPINYRVNGFSYEIYEEDSVPNIPHFLTGFHGETTGIMYVKPIIIVTGYNSELRYKTYNPEFNTFI
jgi:hypothetical protein